MCVCECVCVCVYVWEREFKCKSYLCKNVYICAKTCVNGSLCEYVHTLVWMYASTSVYVCIFNVYVNSILYVSMSAYNYVYVYTDLYTRCMFMFTTYSDNHLVWYP